jgi:perosamine synthetase
MIRRHQLAVAPRITARALLRAAGSLASSSSGELEQLARLLELRFGASRCVLTDSGTSALVLALRLTAGKDVAVALPAYGCVDITSAARFAEVKATLYDIDPNTLSPDLDSVRRALDSGARAIVVAHYYGYPADVVGVRELAAARGVPVIEDAAQAAGGTLHGARLGSFGDVSVLSFGRGKGLFGGHGGALLIRSGAGPDAIRLAPSLGSRRGLDDLAAGVAQWVLGRPGVYGIPASLPWLHLGEMVYRPAHEPGPLSLVAATLVRDALASEASERRSRAWRANVLASAANQAVGLTPIQTIPGGESGYLRLAVVDRGGTRGPAPRLGVIQGYPLTLGQQPELATHLIPGQQSTIGAEELCRSLYTLPTHAQVRGRDVRDLEDWMRGRGAQPLTAAPMEQLVTADVTPQGASCR